MSDPGQRTKTGDIAFEMRGDRGDARTPIVLLHAFPLDRRMWAETMDALAPLRRVIAIDCRGFGESGLGAGTGGSGTTGGGAGIEGIAAFAEDTAAVLDAADVRRAILCGLSMGGYVALAFAARHPDRLAGLVLADTRAGADSPAARGARNEALGLLDARGVEAFLDGSLTRLLSPGALPAVRDRVRALARQPAAAIAGALRALRDREDRTGELGRIKCPTLCLVGEEDVVTPPAESHAMGAAIAGSRVVTIPHAGHLANLENPAAFHAALVEFLAGVS